MLGKVVSESQRNWDDRLPYVMAAYRASVHSSTGYSPNRLFMGRQARMPVDVVMGLPATERDGEQMIDDYVERQRRKIHRLLAAGRRINVDVNTRVSIVTVLQTAVAATLTTSTTRAIAVRVMRIQVMMATEVIG